MNHGADLLFLMNSLQTRRLWLNAGRRCALATPRERPLRSLPPANYAWTAVTGGVFSKGSTIRSAMPRGQGSYSRGGAQLGRFPGRGYNRGGPQGGPQGPRDSSLVCFGSFVHACEDELVYKAVVPDQIPHFNAPVFLENKAQIGRVEEVFGPLSQVMFSVKPVPGVVSESVRPEDRVYVASDKLLPAAYFLKKDRKNGGPRSAGDNQHRKSRGVPGARGGRGKDRPFRGRGGAVRGRGAGFRSHNSGYAGGIKKRPFQR